MVGSKFVGEGTHNVNLTFAQDFSITFILPPEEEAGLDRSSYSESAYN